MKTSDNVITVMDMGIRLGRLGAVNWINPHTEEQTMDYHGYRIVTARDRDGRFSCVVLEGNGASEDNGGYRNRAEAISWGKKMADAMTGSDD